MTGTPEEAVQQAPDTLPADFDFSGKKNVAPTAAQPVAQPAAVAGAPDTLPADFDFKAAKQSKPAAAPKGAVAPPAAPKDMLTAADENGGLPPEQQLAVKAARGVRGLYHGVMGDEESATSKGQTTTASPEAAQLGITPEHVGYKAGEMAHGIYQFGKGLYNDLVNTKTPILIPDKPDTSKQQLLNAVNPPLEAKWADPKANTLVAKYITAPSQAEHDAAVSELEEYKKTHGAEAVGHALSSFLHGTLGEYVPAIGPLAMSIADQAEKGDIGGALAQIASLYAFEKGTGKLKEGIKERVNAKVSDLNKTPEIKQAEANTAALAKDREVAKSKLDTAKAKYDQHVASHEQGIEAPKPVKAAYDKAVAEHDEASAHHELAAEREARLKAAQPTIPQRVGTAVGKAVGKVLPTPAPEPVAEVPAEKIEASPSPLAKLGAPQPSVSPAHASTTIPQEPTEAPRPSYGRIALANDQGTMGTPKLLSAGKNPPTGSTALADIVAATEEKQGIPKIKLPEEKPVEAPKPEVATAADLRALKAKEGKVVDTQDTVEGRVHKLLQEALKPEAPKAEEKAPEAPAEKRTGERRHEEVPVEEERRQGERRVLKGINEKTFQESVFGTGGEKSIDTDAYAKATEQARKELGTDATKDAVIARRNELVAPEAKGAAGDVGEQSRQANPEPTRAETKALPKEEPTGYAAKKEEVVPAGEEGREPAKSAAQYHPAVEQKVNELSDENLRTLAKAHGLNPDEYDFKARDERRHRVERDQLAKDITEQMGEDEKINLGRAAEATEKQGLFQGADTSAKGRAERAAKMFPRLRGPVDEFGNPKVAGGAPDTVGTKEAADKDTEHFANAKKELGDKASISDVAKRAQELKDTHTQLAEHEKSGGSTFSSKGKNLNGTDKYSVGSYPDRTEQVDKLTPERLDEFKKKNADVLSKEGHAVGTWKDPDTGKAVLDVTKLYTDRDEAIAAGKAANQKSIYHLGGEGEIQTGGTGEKSDKPTTGRVNKFGEIVPEVTAEPNARAMRFVVKSPEGFRAIGDTANRKGTAATFSYEEHLGNYETRAEAKQAAEAYASDPNSFQGQKKQPAGSQTLYKPEEGTATKEHNAPPEGFTHELQPSAREKLKSINDKGTIIVTPEGNVHSYDDYDPSAEDYTHSSLFNQILDNHTDKELSKYQDESGDFSDYDPTGDYHKFQEAGGIRAFTTGPEEAGIDIHAGAPAGTIAKALRVADALGRPETTLEISDPKQRFKTVFSKTGTYEQVKNAVHGWADDNGMEVYPGESKNPTVSGGAPEKKLPTGDALIKKYGESSGDPAHTTFILKDGRGVANTGTDHDIMLGGKATDKNPPREQFVAEGNIRVRPRSGGKGGREVSISIPESGVNAKQLAYIQKMAPQLSSGAVLIEVGKPGGEYKVIPYGESSKENLENSLRSLAPILNDKGSPIDENGNPTVSGGSAAAAAPMSIGKMTVEDLKSSLPDLAQKHLTEEEKASITTTATGKPRTAGTQKFIQNMENIPTVQEYIDAALQGEGSRKWYSRSTAAFDAMHEEAPDYFKESDKQKFMGVLAGSSPQQSVAMNLRETLGFWKAWHDAGRPNFSIDKWKEFGEEADKAWKDDGSPRARGMKKGASMHWDYAPTGTKWKAENLLLKNLTLPEAKVPNIIKALNGEQMWPDLTKNAAFKAPSFAENLRKWIGGESTGTKNVTNDSWMGLFGGIDKSALSRPENYHPLSVATRAAAEALGWEPEEAQAAIWSFTQALTEKGVEDPEIVRHYSEDFKDLLENDLETRDLLKGLGVNLDQLDSKLGAIENKPKVSGRSTPTTAHSTGQLRSRIEEARGKGAIPEPKSIQGNLFRENPAFEHRNNPGGGHLTQLRDESVRFNPEEFEPEASPLEKLGEKKKKAPLGKIR